MAFGPVRGIHSTLSCTQQTVTTYREDSAVVKVARDTVTLSRIGPPGDLRATILTRQFKLCKCHSDPAFIAAFEKHCLSIPVVVMKFQAV